MMLRVLGTIFMSLAAVVVALPIVIVCSAALNGGRTMFFPPQDSTLARFGEFFISEPVWTRALTNSVIVALGAATLSVLLAWPIAYRRCWQLLGRSPSRCRRLCLVSGLAFSGHSWADLAPSRRASSATPCCFWRCRW
jgi:ABC-type spermidine/putrescine transport system permease subunit II